jgi:hypothetical protein
MCLSSIQCYCTEQLKGHINLLNSQKISKHFYTAIQEVALVYYNMNSVGCMTLNHPPTIWVQCKPSKSNRNHSQEEIVFIFVHYFWDQSYIDCQNAHIWVFPDCPVQNKCLKWSSHETGNINNKRCSGMNLRCNRFIIISLKCILSVCWNDMKDISNIKKYHYTSNELHHFLATLYNLAVPETMCLFPILHSCNPHHPLQNSNITIV